MTDANATGEPQPQPLDVAEQRLYTLVHEQRRMLQVEFSLWCTPPLTATFKRVSALFTAADMFVCTFRDPLLHRRTATATQYALRLREADLGRTFRDRSGAVLATLPQPPPAEPAVQRRAAFAALASEVQALVVQCVTRALASARAQYDT